MKNYVQLLMMMMLTYMLSVNYLNAQIEPCGPGVGTVIFFEDFDEALGSTTGADASGIPWATSCPGCVAGDIFEVDAFGGTTGLRGNDTNGPATFAVSGIDLSGCAVVAFSFDYEASGYMGSGNLECADECAGCTGLPSDVVTNGGCNNCWDFLYGELDYGSGIVSQNVLLGVDCNAGPIGTTTSAVCNTTDANGDPIDPTMQSMVDINIVMAMWAGTENMVIDNVTLICYTEAEVMACGNAGVTSACPEPMCPDMTGVTADALAVTVTNSTCAIGEDTPSGGSIAAPDPSPCPDGTTLQYSVDGGTTWSNMIPTYDQSTAQTIETRCNCDIDATMSSTATGSVLTVPGTCTPCDYAVTYELDEDCGIFNIINVAVDETNTPGGGFTIGIGTAATGPFTGLTGTENFTADGSTLYYIEIVNSTNSDCVNVIGPITAPAANLPNCGTTFPANPAAPAPTNLQQNENKKQ